MTFEPYYIVLILFWILVLIFNFKEIERAKTIESKQDRQYIYWIQLVLLVGVIVRTLPVDIPSGIFFDEAMSGYDAWCLAYYGVDQHLTSYPVYLRSWGGGMNALYAYISIPFIKCFGLSLPVFRLPMALIGSGSLIFLYYSLRKTRGNYLFILLVVLFVTISPWHIMKSRWALESNIAPDLILIGLCFFLLGYNSVKKKKWYLLGGFFFLALSAYGYAVSWFMLPVFCLLLLVYFHRKKKIKISGVTFYLFELFILTSPLILFASLIFTGGDQIHIGPITISTLEESRHTKTTLFGSGDTLSQIKIFLRAGARLLFLGDDTYRRNTFYLFGQFYNLLSLPFIFYSFYALWKRKSYEVTDIFFVFWLIACIPIILFVEPNVNHWNILWFPLIYFSASGVYFLLIKLKWVWCKYLIIGCFLCAFLAFGRKYISFNKEIDTTYSDFRKEFDKFIYLTKTKNIDCIYFEEIYPLALFYDPVSPYVFYCTKSKESGGPDFDQIASYGKYKFYLPYIIKPEAKTAYIFRNSVFLERDIDISGFHIEKGDTYTLLWND